MKKLALIAFGMLAISILNAQNANAVFFTENGERFSVILNGMLQNSQPETWIRVTDLPAPNYKVKIIFEQKRLGEINKTIYLTPETETTFAIRQNKKKGYLLRLMNNYPVLQSPELAPGQAAIGFQPQGIPAMAGSTTTIVNNTTINNNMNVSTSGVGNNVNVVNSNDGAGAQNAKSNTGIGNQPPIDPNPYVLPGYNGVYGCQRPMARPDFEQAMQSIKAKSFEDSKLTIAKQLIGSNCLLSTQVKEIMLLFSFEDTRLDFAKFAYGFTLDMGNYFKVNDAFTFESSIDELNKYIQSSKK